MEPATAPPPAGVAIAPHVGVAHVDAARVDPGAEDRFVTYPPGCPLDGGEAEGDAPARGPVGAGPGGRVEPTGRGDVSGASGVAAGHVAVEPLRERLRTLHPSVLACDQAFLPRAPPPGGAAPEALVKVAFAIDASGRARCVEVVESVGVDRAHEECVARLVSTLSFEGHDGAPRRGEVRVVYPFRIVRARSP